MCQTIWKAIPGYEGFYEASTDGRIRSVYRYKRILKPMISNTGYKRVDLFKNKNRRQWSVHRLIAMTFVENPNNKPFVNHLDEDKLNNDSSNLEWVTHIENCRYGTAIERRKSHIDYSKRKVNNANQIKKCSMPISQYTKEDVFIKDWSSISECSKAIGISKSGISMVVRGERPHVYGFIFRKKER